MYYVEGKLTHDYNHSLTVDKNNKDSKEYLTETDSLTKELEYENTNE